MLRVQYFPEIGNVLNHFFIPVSEVEAGQWNIRYSNDDLLSVKTYRKEKTQMDLNELIHKRLSSYEDLKGILASLQVNRRYLTQSFRRISLRDGKEKGSTQEYATR